MSEKRPSFEFNILGFLSASRQRGLSDADAIKLASLEFGMSKRELFAALAMQGALANENSSGTPGASSTDLAEFVNAVAIFSVLSADALIAELEKARK